MIDFLLVLAVIILGGVAVVVALFVVVITLGVIHGVRDVKRVLKARKALDRDLERILRGRR